MTPCHDAVSIPASRGTVHAGQTAIFQLGRNPNLHGPEQFATRGRLNSPPEAGPIRHPWPVDPPGRRREGPSPPRRARAGCRFQSSAGGMSAIVNRNRQPRRLVEATAKAAEIFVSAIERPSLPTRDCGVWILILQAARFRKLQTSGVRGTVDIRMAPFNGSSLLSVNDAAFIRHDPLCIWPLTAGAV